MDNPKERFFTLTDNLFTFSSNACDCVIDVENIKPGEVKETVKIQSLPNNPIKLAFAPSRGMVLLANNGSIKSDHVLSDLLAIPETDKEKLFKFFSEFGFFFPVVANDYEALDIDSLRGLVRRIKAVVNLMSAIGETKKDYKRILGLVAFLLFEKPIEINFSCFGDQPFKTCEHALFHEVETISSMRGAVDTEYNHYDPNDEQEVYTVPDTIYPPAHKLSAYDLTNILGGFDEAPIGTTNSKMFKSIARMYFNGENFPNEMRRAIDFLFHFQNSIAVIKNWSCDGKVEFFDTDENVKSRYSSMFNSAMKDALIDTAKMVIRDEIGYNLGGMRPQYDISTMAPAWEIQDLLTGIYVSIFFIRSSVESYRKCSNPSCNRMFLVSRTSEKRKYCSSSCRNASAQRAHRYRKKSGQ